MLNFFFIVCLTLQEVFARNGVTGLVYAAWNFTCVYVLNNSLVRGMMIFCPHTSDMTWYWMPRTMWLPWVRGSSRSNRGLIYAVIQFCRREKGCTVPPKVTATILLNVQFYLFLYFFACHSCFWLCLSLFLTKPAASDGLCRHLPRLINLSVPQKTAQKHISSFNFLLLVDKGAFIFVDSAKH